jgi:hypothetical protein
VSNASHQLNTKQIAFILSSPNGPLAKDLIKRGKRVESRAKRNLAGGHGAPRRIDTGLLRASISSNLIFMYPALGVRVGSGVKYARFVHDGTGLYGPKKTLIRPKTGKVLVFPSKIYGAKKGKFMGKVVVPYVRGMKANPYLKDALPAFHQ